LDVDYKQCITWITHQQLWGYKVEDKWYMGVSEQKRLNTTALFYPRTIHVGNVSVKVTPLCVSLRVTRFSLPVNIHQSLLSFTIIFGSDSNINECKIWILLIWSEVTIPDFGVCTAPWQYKHVSSGAWLCLQCNDHISEYFDCIN
jgi:hypothetical protein